jgi:glutathione S-transferase
MKLYYSPGACSMASHIMLHELGMKAEYEAVDLRAHKTKSGKDFYTINAKGYVPALEMENGELLTESSAVLFYLSDLQPKPFLKGTVRYRLIEWCVFISTELHKTLGALFQKPAEDIVKSTKEKFAKRLDLVEKHLAGRDFLLPEFSAADAYLFTVLNWTPGFQIDLAPWKNTSAFVERVKSRPSVQQTMKDEGLLK